MAGGAAIAGYPIGILTLPTRHALVPGNVQHAASFSGPVLYESVQCADPFALLRGSEEMEAPILAAAQSLCRLGVGAIVGACGSFGFYQRSLAAAVTVPVVASVMVHVPFLLSMFRPTGKIGVICARAASLNPRLYDACGIREPERLAIVEMAGGAQFDHLMSQAEPVNMRALCAETVTKAQILLQENPDVRAIVLQCSDLPPFAAEVQAVCGCPVFDMVLLIEWLASALLRTPFRSPRAWR